MAGRDWAAIAESQRCILANDKLDSSRVQGLLDTFGVLVEREAETCAQDKVTDLLHTAAENYCAFHCNVA